MRVLDRDEIERLLANAPARYRVVLAAALFLGLRQSELLALRWSDVDFDAGVVRVRRALGRDGALGPLKTPSAARDVVLMPSLARLLKAHRLASPYSRDDDFVFTTATGRPMHWRNVSKRGLGVAVKRACLDGGDRPNFRFHDCRHTFASMLIEQGANIAYVSQQLGHASPAITLTIYAHVVNRAGHAERTSAMLEAAFGGVFAKNP